MNQLTYEDYINVKFGYGNNPPTYQSWLHQQYLKIINNLNQDIAELKSELQKEITKNFNNRLGWEE
jgi:hypothetical protein